MIFFFFFLGEYFFWVSIIQGSHPGVLVRQLSVCCIGFFSARRPGKR